MAAILQPASPLWRGTPALLAQYEMHQGHEKAVQIHQPKNPVDFHPQKMIDNAMRKARLASLVYDSKHQVVCQVNVILREIYLASFINQAGTF